MPIKNYKPTTNARRKMSVLTYDEVTSRASHKSLLAVSKSNAGRNNQGKITIRHRGGGNKRKYRIIDFKQIDKLNIEGTVKAIEYDPNRNTFIALIFYKDGDKRYVLAPNGLKVDDVIVTSPKAKVRVGNRTKLSSIPMSIEIHNIELFPGQGGQLVRGAGTFASVLGIDGEYAQVQLPSGEVRKFLKDCYASIGKMSNEDVKNVRIGKAGRMRHKGRRPQVLGKSMNPVEHPHGGGEGHSPVGLKHPKTPWGKPALGYKTRNNPRTNKFIIRSRKK